MGAFHQLTAISTVQDVGWALYNFLTNGSQTALQIVNDGTEAVYIDTGETNSSANGYGTPTSADAFGPNSFIVVEPTFDNASGARRWQAKIERIGFTSDWGVTCSPNGGFSTSSSDFGSEPITHTPDWLETTPAASDNLYLSSSDLDTWTDPDTGATVKYGYLRILFDDASSSSVLDGLYCGGYIPFDKTNDKDPFVMLAGYPRIEQNATASTWGLRTSSTRGRAPLENGQAISSMVSNGYAFIACNRHVQHNNKSQTRNGDEAELQVFVHMADGTCLGYFGDNTMKGCSDAIADWTVNNAGTRIAVEDLAHSWAP
jgi:hypothetical protein